MVYNIGVQFYILWIIQNYYNIIEYLPCAAHYIQIWTSLQICMSFLCRTHANLCCCLVAKCCPTLFWLHRLYPARLLCKWDFPGKNTELVDISFSRGSSWPRDQIQVSALQLDSLPLSHQGSPIFPVSYIRCLSEQQTSILHTKDAGILVSLWGPVSFKWVPLATILMAG